MSHYQHLRTDFPVEAGARRVLLAVLNTPVFITLYTLLSNILRDSNDLRQNVIDVVLGRLHHDQPVHRQFSSRQRTVRPNRMHDHTALATLENTVRGAKSNNRTPAQPYDLYSPQLNPL